ncbi:hypothetical protein GBP346_B2056 [Burkholderia pseudomallei MSHR346]|nr:hypothetical protein GBP346_B2056 [Burkholderia pseudomallei MSHR346]
MRWTGGAAGGRRRRTRPADGRQTIGTFLANHRQTAEKQPKARQGTLM